MRNRAQKLILPAIILASFPVPAMADITGPVDATITLSAGCIVNGQNLDDGDASADFGTLDFGTHNTLFTTADGQVVSGGSAINIQCSPGVAPVLSFDAGLHDGLGTGGGLRAMAHTATAGQYVTYSLYSNAARTAVIPIGGGVTLSDSGAAQQVDIYGRAFGTAGLVTGIYNDVITVVLEL